MAQTLFCLTEWLGRTPQRLMFIITNTLLALLYCGSGSSNLENI